MLGIDELRALVARYTWLPGWWLEVAQHPFEGLHLRIRTQAANAYRPGESVPLDVWAPIPLCETERQFELWLAGRLCQVAVHEALEFFRRDGEVVVDPHAEDYNHLLTAHRHDWGAWHGSVALSHSETARFRTCKGCDEIEWDPVVVAGEAEP